MAVGLEFFYTSFFDLTSDRQINNSVGPIPWSSIIKYCEHYNLDHEETEEFLYFIRKMDSEYTSFLNKAK